MKNDQMVRYYIFFIFLFYLTTVVTSYTLLRRNDHTASYLDDKIYFLGGETDYTSFTSDFFYLDVFCLTQNMMNSKRSFIIYLNILNHRSDIYLFQMN